MYIFIVRFEFEVAKQFASNQVNNDSILFENSRNPSKRIQN